MTYVVNVSLPCALDTGPWVETVRVIAPSRIEAQNEALEIIADRFDLPNLDLHVVQV